MKKIGILFVIVSILFLLSSCGSTPSETLTIPKLNTTESFDHLKAIEEEREYHKNLGMTIIEDLDSDLFQSTYDHHTYEGQYQLLTDYLYRAWLDIDILEARGFSNETNERYKNLISAFLEDNKPKCLLPQNWVQEHRLNHFWRDPLVHLLEIDESKTVSNERLMMVYEYDCLCSSKMGGNIRETLSPYPLLSARILPPKAQVLSQQFDSGISKTSLTVDAGNASEIWVKEGNHEIVFSSQFVTIYKPGERILFSPAFSGEVSVAIRGKNGLLGETTHITIEKNTESIIAETVSFSSNRLNKAIRGYLKKTDSETITKADLSSIEQIFITGDLIFFNGEGITNEIANQQVVAEIQDFNFLDFESFPCLSRLTVKYNNTGNPKGDAVLALSYLELTGCGITDLSGLKDCRISQLYLIDNKIQTAEVLSTARSLEYLSLQMNPLKTIKLPSKSITNVNLRGTEISKLEFLKNVEILVTIDIEETKVKDINALCDVSGIIEIYCPNGTNYDVLRSISTLKDLYVGDKKIDLK